MENQPDSALTNSEILAVRQCRVMEIRYERLKEPRLVTRLVEPVGIMFPEYYFCIDRIRSFRILEERFSVPYRGKFNEGEFRKRVQFMYGGKLEQIRFRYTGASIEAVLDRLPAWREASGLKYVCLLHYSPGPG